MAHDEQKTPSYVLYAHNVEIANQRQARMDVVARTFDEWALNGRSEAMEREHKKNVVRFLGGVRLAGKFSFLDVGCGNGWTIQRIAAMKGCTKAVGIDKSRNMIRAAKARSESAKTEFYCTELEDWKYKGTFDYAFSMEAIYYSKSAEAAVRKVYSLLKRGGRFFCGMDFYAENRATAHWQRSCGMPMLRLSEDAWRDVFVKAGFRTKTRRVTDPDSSKKWKRELGTLFLTGTKPMRPSKV